MTDRFPVLHIPRPGLWLGAPYGAKRRPPGWVENATGWVSHDETIAELMAMPKDDAWLRLDDPLGLGLAGLAATVALRLGVADPMPGTALALGDFAWELAEQDWYPVDAFDYGPGVEQWLTSAPTEVITTAATFIALTDALCAAVSPELGEHEEVARWVFEDHCWSLVAGGRGRAFRLNLPLIPGTAGGGVTAAGADDWLPALQAALALEPE